MSTGAYNPNTLRPQRRTRNFVVLAGGYRNPFYSMRASTSGLAGQAVVYHTLEGQVDISTVAQQVKERLAGWLEEDVRDLAALNGYRNPSSTTAGFGDQVPIVQGSFIASTRIYTGTVARGDYMETTTTGHIAATSLTGSGLSNALASGMICGVAEAVNVNDLNPTFGGEPAQSATDAYASNRDAIRVRFF